MLSIQLTDRVERAQFDRHGDRSQTPPPPEADPRLLPHAIEAGQSAQSNSPNTITKTQIGNKLVKATDLPIPRPPRQSNQALHPVDLLPVQADPIAPEDDLMAEQEDELVFVETQDVPNFHSHSTVPATAVHKPTSEESLPSPSVSPAPAPPVATQAEPEPSTQLTPGQYASDVDMLDSSIDFTDPSFNSRNIAAVQPPAAPVQLIEPESARATRSPAFVPSPGPRRSKRAPSPGLAPPQDSRKIRRSSPRLRSASPAPVPTPPPAKQARQTARQAFAALKRDFATPEDEGDEQGGVMQGLDEVVAESYESIVEDASQVEQREPFTQAAFTQAALADSSAELESQMPMTQAPPPTKGAALFNGSSQSQTESSGLTYASIPSSILREVEAEALARPQPHPPAAVAATAAIHVQPSGLEHAYLQAPEAWAGYGGETQMPVTQAGGLAIDEVAEHATSSWDGEGAEDGYVGFTQADLRW